MKPLRVLLVEDSPTDMKLVQHELQRMGRSIELVRVEEAAQMRAQLSDAHWDVVLSDWALPHFDALSALEILKASSRDIPFIIVSGTIGEEAAVDAMRLGAKDYILKDKLGRLLPAIERELKDCAMRDAHRRTTQALRESEERLRHSQKMEAVGTLAGGIAHDFNNVLSVIMSYCELLLTDLAKDDPKRDDVREMWRAGERAAELTRQLLMFSRRQILAPTVVELDDVVFNVEKMLRRLIGERVELALVRHTPAIRVRVDRNSIEQVIVNLAVNARDAMPHGGKLTIETSSETLDDELARARGVIAGAHAILRVTDTGVGMDKATQARAFEPFFTTKHGGTGLGLASVFGIVTQSNGAIAVESTVGVGTTFTVRLPLVLDPLDVIHPPTLVPSTRDVSETILVVEDEEQVRNVTCTMLRKRGYRVLEASNPHEAIAVSTNHVGDIDLLLTDVVMPQMNGPELARTLVAARPSMKLLCMSGYTENSATRETISKAEMAYLQKPFTPTLLYKKVAEVLDG
jgi:two-component system, cell cycle sensor histidine kinase and response regulator CckA